MKRILSFLTVAAAAILLTACGSKNSTHKLITPVKFSDVTINDGFWSPRLQSHKDVTLKVCIDQIENQTGRIRNFENAAKGEGEHSGIYFDDSDVYKALEGMAYSLQNNPDPELEAKCDEWIDKFAAAQQKDGYLNTYYTLTGLENRWSDMGMHEMYCAGHMTEAAVAYYNVTGKHKLLDVAIKMADHMMTVFGPGKRDWVPGHEEIELALVKLYEVTGEKKYLDFAEWLINERGHGFGTWVKWRQESYYQDDTPVREMTSIAGHAVRAMYLYCGMADVAAYTGDQGYMTALDSLWEDVVFRNMYVTGGIGQSSKNEGFTTDYSLPNLTAYCETCASVGMVLWNWRMNQFTGDSKYVDVLERSLYNGALAGISLAGDRFFYVNPLESLGTHHRQAWYGCACCPSQICRFLPSIGNYIYGVAKDAIYVNLYIGGLAKVKYGNRTLTLAQKTDYPWKGDVTLTVGTSLPVTTQLRLRVPGWCKAWSFKVNGESIAPEIDKGYAVIERRWRNGDTVSFSMDMSAEIVAADERVKEDEGLRAVQRGPLVYCMEEIDNPSYDDIRLESSTRFDEVWEPGLLRGVVTLNAIAVGQPLKLIPYYAWDNREAGRMKVWIPLQ
jgi:DUF1680 family protein